MDQIGTPGEDPSGRCHAIMSIAGKFFPSLFPNTIVECPISRPGDEKAGKKVSGASTCGSGVAALNAFRFCDATAMPEPTAVGRVWDKPMQNDTPTVNASATDAMVVCDN